MMYFVTCSQNGIDKEGRRFNAFRFRGEDFANEYYDTIWLYGTHMEIGKEYLLEIKEAPEPKY